MKLHTLLSSVIAGMMVSAASQALVITPNTNATTLANNIAGNAITVNSASYTGAAQAAGTFTGGNASGLDLNAGVVLSNGWAKSAEGPNNDPLTGEEFNTPGDASLGAGTFDAAALNFNFNVQGAAGGELSLNFLFGSEDYQYEPDEFSFGYLDSIGIFLDGINLAKVPGDNAIVSVTSINSENHSNLYVDNKNRAQGSSPYNTQLNGFTKSIQILLSGFDTNAHNLKIAIADVGDAQLNSWLFVGADSLSYKAPSTGIVPEPSSLALLGLALLAVGLRQRSRRQ